MSKEEKEVKQKPDIYYELYNFIKESRDDIGYFYLVTENMSNILSELINFPSPQFNNKGLYFLIKLRNDLPNHYDYEGKQLYYQQYNSNEFTLSEVLNFSNTYLEWLDKYQIKSTKYLKDIIKTNSNLKTIFDKLMGLFEKGLKSGELIKETIFSISEYNPRRMIISKSNKIFNTNCYEASNDEDKKINPDYIHEKRINNEIIFNLFAVFYHYCYIYLIDVNRISKINSLITQEQNNINKNISLSNPLFKLKFRDNEKAVNLIKEDYKIFLENFKTVNSKIKSRLTTIFKDDELFGKILNSIENSDELTKYFINNYPNNKEALTHKSYSPYF